MPEKKKNKIPNSLLTHLGPAYITIGYARAWSDWCLILCRNQWGLRNWWVGRQCAFFMSSSRETEPKVYIILPAVSFLLQCCRLAAAGLIIVVVLSPADKGSDSVERYFHCVIIHICKAHPEEAGFNAAERRAGRHVELYFIYDHPPELHFCFESLFFEKGPQIHPEE